MFKASIEARVAVVDSCDCEKCYSIC